MLGIPLFLVAASAIWVAVDSARLVERDPNSLGPAGVSPCGWLLACTVLWVVFFPYYLKKRSKARVPAKSLRPTA